MKFGTFNDSKLTLLGYYVAFESFFLFFFSIQDNLTRTIDDDDEIIIPEIQQATEHYCEKNNCDDLPATQHLKIKVIMTIIIDKYEFREN